MIRTLALRAIAAGGGALFALAAPACAQAAGCAADNGGLSLPPGFCASVFADNLGHVRHAVVDKTGVLYVNVWSGRYYPGSPAPDNGFLIALQDADKDGKAETIVRFGETKDQGDTGGSGIALYGGFIYAEAGDKIVRYALPANAITPPRDARPETVISGLPTTGDHNMHPFVIDQKGMLFLDSGSATNSCQPRNRQPGVAGAKPCTELETRAGVWRYDAKKLNQPFSAKERYATGLRNAEGLAFDSSGRLFATMHGRDQLIQNWASLYPDAKHATELPAEELVEVKAGGDYGWPICYYDNFQKKLVLAPEYGGDGGKATGECASKIAPIAGYPAHWAPNDLEIYTGSAFPKAYQGGAFITFHGSWNRSPEPQSGFNVVFQPMSKGKTTGDWIIFADGFAGAGKATGRADRRPMAVAMAPDGALFITDDVKGRIWRVTYSGSADAKLQAAPKADAAPGPVASASPAAPAHTDALPPGVTADLIAVGDRVYHATTCAACHGSDGAGTGVGPNLAAGKYIWGDGSLAALTKTIHDGVPAPKEFRSPMPPMGGAQLSDDDLKALSAYVWSLGHKAS